jgi:hypothetical protein
MHCKHDPIYVFSGMNLRGLVSNFHIHVSVSDLYLLTISTPILLQQDRWAAQFHFWQFVFNFWCSAVALCASSPDTVQSHIYSHICLLKSASQPSDNDNR